MTAPNEELQQDRALVYQLHWKSIQAAKTGLVGFCRKDIAGWVGKGFDLGRVGEDEYNQNMYRLETLKELIKKTGATYVKQKSK